MSTAERRKKERVLRREEILMAAEKLFHSKGYDSTTMMDIAQSIDLSTGTLYLYFPNKEVLYAAVSLKILHSLLKKVEIKSKNGNENPCQTLINIKDVLYSFYETDCPILLNVFRFQSSTLIRELPSEIVEYLKELSQPSQTAIANTVNQGIEMGIFKPCNAVAITDIIWSTFSGLVIYEESKRALDKRKSFLKETLDLSFSIIIEGIKKRD